MSIRLADPYGSIETRERQYGMSAVKLLVTANELGVANFSVGCVGVFKRITIKPGVNADQPSNNFDITITDEHGLVLYNNIIIPNNSVTVAYPSSSSPKLVYGNCTFLLENMGDSKTCEVICYFAPRAS